MKPNAWQNWLSRDKYLLPLPPLEKRLLVQHVLGISAEEYIKRSPIALNETEQQQLSAFIARREAGEPIAKIIGSKPFWKDDFITSKDTLDPRPDSEWLIEALLELHPDRKKPYHILDCGTGTGCLLLSALREFPHATGTAIDQSAEALLIAQENAKCLNLSHRAAFHQHDWNLGWTINAGVLYDVIISNPPYIPTDDIDHLMDDVKIYDPKAALDGGKSGLDAYKQLFTICQNILKPDGWFVCEIGHGQHDQVVALAENQGFHFEKHWRDLGGIIRILAFKLAN